MKFLEVLVAGLGFHFGLVVAQSLEVVEASDHLGFCWPSYESDRLQNLPLLRSPSCFSLCETLKELVLKVLDFIFRKENKIWFFFTDL